ncbi:hypothetical protein [Rhizobium leguminosarum]|uniref:hypothetical protein n=1 Tax=Rhizobium leguminosarum TaxID=384 RepID=UPI003F97146C
MSDMPIWLQVVQALATTVIAGTIGVIAWRQWRTAHTKMLFDLFEKRIAAYNGLIDAMRPAFRDGTIRSFNDFVQLRHAVDGAHFLFGDDVRKILKELISIGATMNTAAGVMKDNTSPGYGEWVDKNHTALVRLIEIMDELPAIMEDYLSFSEKKVPTFVDRLRERNKIRLSYADDKQR